MFYLSPQLTVLMLALVPPISLGAVRLEPTFGNCTCLTSNHEGHVWPIFETSINSHPRSCWCYVRGRGSFLQLMRPDGTHTSSDGLRKSQLPPNCPSFHCFGLRVSYASRYTLELYNCCISDLTDLARGCQSFLVLHVKRRQPLQPSLVLRGGAVTWLYCACWDMVHST
jgi:hypothetical protein